jgi:leucyl aminopeptidase
MDFILTKEKPERITCDLFAIACFEEPKDKKKKALPPKLVKEDGGVALDRLLKGELTRMIKAGSFSGASGKTKLLYTEGRIPARHVLLVGLGKKKEATLATVRNAAAKVAKVGDELRIRSAALVLEGRTFVGTKPAERLKAIVEGMELGRYRFDVYKEKASRTERTVGKVHVLSSKVDASLSNAIKMGGAAAASTELARDMSNTPSNDMTPTIMARFARDTANRGKLRYTEMGPSQIEKERMRAFLAVSQGSAQPPVFIHMRYAPSGKSRKTVAIVGKGVTFDSGGISIKPLRGMEEMKSDMGGAAAVIGLMKAVAELKPRVTVDAYLAATENMPDGKAIKPGDIVTARNGKTIEFISTDAEGRMILADGLSFAADKKPDYLIDVATLTGTCPYAVGEKYAAVMGTDQELIDMLKKAGDQAGEPVWQLPLEKDYAKGLTTGPADLKNLGTSKADTINAGLFLSNFVGEVPWAHLDIASTAWASEASDLAPKGATGAGVRILVQFLMNF